MVIFYIIYHLLMMMQVHWNKTRLKCMCWECSFLGKSPRVATSCIYSLDEHTRCHGGCTLWSERLIYS